MPELPEVETIRRSLLPLLKDDIIVAAELTCAMLLKNATCDDFKKKLIGKTFQDIHRRGKYLKFNLDDDLRLLVHLRMTGQLRYEDPETEMRKHNHFVLQLKSGKQLRFVDTRKFGMLYIGSENEVTQCSGWHRLGPEPLADDFKLEDFLHILSTRGNRNIKALLLDQHAIAGLGNIYADEALFRARIHPESTAGALMPEQQQALYNAIRGVLADGIEHRGTSINDYVDGFGKSGSFQFQLQAYGRTNEPCLLCGAPMTRLKIAGRSTHACEKCQKKYSL